MVAVLWFTTEFQLRWLAGKLTATKIWWAWRIRFFSAILTRFFNLLDSHCTHQTSLILSDIRRDGNFGDHGRFSLLFAEILLEHLGFFLLKDLVEWWIRSVVVVRIKITLIFGLDRWEFWRWVLSQVYLILIIASHFAYDVFHWFQCVVLSHPRCLSCISLTWEVFLSAWISYSTRLIPLQVRLAYASFRIWRVFDNFLCVSLLEFAHSAMVAVSAHSTPHLGVFVRGARISQLQIEFYRFNLLHADGGPWRGALVIGWKLQKVVFRACFELKAVVLFRSVECACGIIFWRVIAIHDLLELPRAQQILIRFQGLPLAGTASIDAEFRCLAPLEMMRLELTAVLEGHRARLLQGEGVSVLLTIPSATATQLAAATFLVRLAGIHAICRTLLLLFFLLLNDHFRQAGLLQRKDVASSKRATEAAARIFEGRRRRVNNVRLQLAQRMQLLCSSRVIL